MKDTYIFNKHRFSYCLDDGSILAKDLGDKMIEEELSKGYIPLGVRVKKKVINAINKYGFPIFSYRVMWEEKNILLATCASSFAGKKQARIIYEKNKNLLNRNDFDRLYLTNK